MFRRHEVSLVLALCLLPQVLVAQTVLNFPRVISSPETGTVLSIVNPTTSEVSVTMTAFQPNGTPVVGNGVHNPITVTIPAGGQYVHSYAETFPNAGMFNGWVQASSATRGLSGSFVNSNVWNTDMDGSGAIDASVEFILPLASEDGLAKTEVSLVNANSDVAMATLTLFAADGSTLATRNISLNGHALLRQTLQSTFGSLDFSNASHIRVRSDQPISGYEVVANYEIPGTDIRRETLGVPGQFSGNSTDYTLPQFVTGANWVSYLNIVNGSGLSQDVTLNAYRDDGRPWLSSNGLQLTIPGNGSLKIDVGALFGLPQDELATGWIGIQSANGSLVADIAYGNAQSASFALVQGVEFSRTLRTGILTRISEGDALFTGVTIVNSGTQRANIDIFTLRPDGTTVGQSSFSLGPNERVGKLLSEMVPASLSQPSGWAFLRSSEPVAMSGLFGTSNGAALADIPVSGLVNEFNPFDQATLAITGRVSNAGAERVVISISGPVTATTFTDASGRYAFTQLPHGNYKVSVVKAGAVFFPSERVVNVGTTNMNEINFEGVGLSEADVPAFTFLSPSATLTGNAAISATVLGFNFNPASVVRLNGEPLQTLFISPMELRATIPAYVLTQPSVLNLSVTTPPPGGGISNEMTLTVNPVASSPLIEGRTAVGHVPAGVAIDHRRKVALVTSETDDSIVIIDLKTQSRVGEIKVGRSPAEGIAVDEIRNRAIVANVGGNDVWVVDLATSDILAKIPVGEFPLGLAYNPATDQAIVANGRSNTVSVIDMARFTVIAEVPVSKRPSEIAIDSGLNLAVITNSQDNTVSVMDVTVNQIIDTIPVGLYPRGVAVNSANHTAVVANANSNDLSIIDLTTRQVVATIRVGVGPTGVAVDPTTNRAVVTNSGVNKTTPATSANMTASVIDLDTREIIANVPVGSAPFGVDLDEDEQRAVVADYGSNDVTIIRIPNPKPRITDISPKTFPADATTVTITVTGTGFLPTSVVTIRGQALSTIFVSRNELRAIVPADLLGQLMQQRAFQSVDGKADGVYQSEQSGFEIAVSNPSPGGGESAPPEDARNMITAENPKPLLSSMSPTSAEMGSGSVEITLNGNNFFAGSVVHFGANTHKPATVLATRMTVVIPAAELKEGEFAVNVTNPAPGGGITKSLSFNVIEHSNPAPSIRNVLPGQISAGSGGTDVTISGSNFGSFTTVSIDGKKVQASISAESITLFLSASQLAGAQTINGLISNDGPGGGSASFTISVVNPAPEITTFTPSSVDSDVPSVELVVKGRNFLRDSTITLSETSITTQFVSSTELHATIQVTTLLKSGSLKIGVRNPGPGGGLAQGGTLTVNLKTQPKVDPTPTLTEISPRSGASKTVVELTVSGTNFNKDSVILFDGRAQKTTFVSSTTLTASIELSTEGKRSVAVKTSTPKLVITNSLDFVVETTPATTTPPAGGSTSTSGGTGTSGGSGTTTKPAGTPKIEISPAQATLTARNQTESFSVIATDADGKAISGTAQWSSSNPDVATVNTSGVVTAVESGTTTISVTRGGLTASATVKVARSVASVKITADSTGTIKALGRKRQFNAQAKDANGFEIPGKIVIWISTSINIVTISSSGEATARGNGHASVRATIDGISAESDIDVSQVVTQITITASESGTFKSLNKSRQYRASGRDAEGNEVSGRSASWRASTGGIVDVSGDGEVTSRKNGNATVTATIDGVNGSVDVEVSQAVAHVVLSDVIGVLSARGSNTKMTFSATVTDENNNVISGKTVSWSTSDSDVASINSKGVVTAGKAGIVTITGEVDGVKGTAKLTVTP